jgi:hypothetical protein
LSRIFFGSTSLRIEPTTSIDRAVVQLPTALIVLDIKPGSSKVANEYANPIKTANIQGFVAITFIFCFLSVSVKSDNPAVHINILSGISTIDPYKTPTCPYTDSIIGNPIKLALLTVVAYWAIIRRSGLNLKYRNLFMMR